jgi:hypothetical protein
MGTKRTRRTIERIGISAEALEAWQRGDRLGLVRALGLQPWQAHPFDVADPEPPADMIGTMYAASWPRIWRIRQELLEMGGPPGVAGSMAGPWGRERPPRRRPHRSGPPRYRQPREIS